jgi:hypothetical protein
MSIIFIISLYTKNFTSNLLEDLVWYIKRKCIYAKIGF